MVENFEYVKFLFNICEMSEFSDFTMLMFYYGFYHETYKAPLTVAQRRLTIQCQ